ncbi:ABC transporter substrate-binding protein [Paenibacillus hodogayensis]|uniref:ABC transporter substrate-binding protein n=1 Tax=Paenibacillus hodogayensis TaxID=279208 RepID=A0ABV5VPY7_9BACL
MMKLRGKSVRLTITVLASVSVLFGCGTRQDNPETNKPAANPMKYDEAFSITFFNATGSNEAYFRENTEPFMKKVFPNVTINYIQTAKGSTIQELITAGNIPDIMLINSSQVISYNNLGLLEDLTPLAKTNNVDLSRFDDHMMETIKKFTPKGELYVLPWSHLPMALYYNKSIFDKFGVAYPKEGMTWDDVAALTRKLSRMDGGVAYRGFDMNRSTFLRLNPLSLSYVDPKMEKAIANTDGWREFITTFSDLYKIPGNELPAKSVTSDQAFFKDKTLAMNVTYGNFPTPENAEMIEAWQSIDLVSLPMFKTAPDTGTQYSGASLAVSKTSKVKDKAMLLIAAATSDEAQKHGAAIGRYPTVKNKDVLDQFGQGTPQLSSKNLKALQRLKVAATTFSSEYDAATLPIITSTFDDILKGTVDMATGLREADEKMNAKIAEEKAKAK